MRTFRVGQGEVVRESHDDVDVVTEAFTGTDVMTSFPLTPRRR
jgi:hypothetical protein